MDRTKTELKGGNPEMHRLFEANGGLGGTARQGGSAARIFAGRGPRIMLAPDGIEGLGGGGDGGKPGGEGGKPVDGGKTPEGNDGGDGGAQKPVRPDWLPETMWDTDSGFRKADFDALVSLKAESDSRAASTPEAADKYEVKLPASFKLPEGFELPQGEKIIDDKDPRVAAAKDWALARKLTQPEFEELLAFGAQMDIAERQRLNAGVAAEREKLGGRAKERVGAVTTWLDAKLGADFGQSLHSMMFTARQVEAFERLMQIMKGDVPGRPGAGREGGKDPSKIEGYENMSFRQKMAAIDAAKAGN